MLNEFATASSHIGRRAIVIGAGVSGLSAANALADHFEEVIVLERDELPYGATPRPGAPQGKQARVTGGRHEGAGRAVSGLRPRSCPGWSGAGQSRFRNFAGISWHGSFSTAGVELAHLLAEPATDDAAGCAR